MIILDIQLFIFNCYMSLSWISEEPVMVPIFQKENVSYEEMETAFANVQAGYDGHSNGNKSKLLGKIDEIWLVSDLSPASYGYPSISLEKTDDGVFVEFLLAYNDLLGGQSAFTALLCVVCTVLYIPQFVYFFNFVNLNTLCWDNKTNFATDLHNLKNVSIPNSVTSIGNTTFAFCSSLTSVTFRGTIPSGGFYILVRSRGWAIWWTSTFPEGSGLTRSRTVQVQCGLSSKSDEQWAVVPCSLFTVHGILG
ncbi:MAG: leucine-rich repeat domain-containing protein [Treponema sp.]|jgi:hypothetical protein|nr:leucine-rich repeat domain-containing protein [Treponema sp.]